MTNVKPDRRLKQDDENARGLNAQCPMPNAQCPMPNAQCRNTEVGGKSLLRHSAFRIRHSGCGLFQQPAKGRAAGSEYVMSAIRERPVHSWESQ